MNFGPIAKLFPAALLVLSACQAAPQPQPEQSPANQGAGTGPGNQADALPKNAAGLLNPSAAVEQAPPTFKARFTSSKGNFTILVHRDWAPIGADRFYNLVKVGFYDEARFFRVVPGFMVQFGLAANPQATAAWKSAPMNDDPVTQTNKRAFVTYAKTGQPNSRSTQIFINYGNNARLDAMGFAPFGEVVEGMDVVDKINAEHGEKPNQGAITSQGNAYLNAQFPTLDFVKVAVVLK